MHRWGQRFFLPDASVGYTVPTNIEMAVLFAAVAGFASHLLYFIRGEHHMNAPTLFYAYISLALGTLLCQVYISEYLYAQAVQNTTAITGAYALSLFTSMTIYRTCFHRLHSFPGPFLARVSKLWHVYHVRHSQNHLLLHSLHKKYGSFVRTGR